MFSDCFMYKICLQDPNNNNHYLEFFTHDSTEALDILIESRSKIEKKNYQWITNYFSILIPTNDAYEAMSVFVNFRNNILKHNIVVSEGRCVIDLIETKYSNQSIEPNNIINSMKIKNFVLNHLINKLNLEVIEKL